MKKIIATLTMITILLSTIPAQADSGWEFRFFGINPKDFKDRSVGKIIIGGVTSILAHEFLGHLLSSELTGMGHGYIDWGRRVPVAGDGYKDSSSNEQAIYSASGMIVQSAGSIILTAIPSTRHTDFTFGWNTATCITGFGYGITKGFNDDTSDVRRMNERDWPGTEIAYATGIVGGITSYISLNKYKDVEEK